MPDVGCVAMNVHRVTDFDDISIDFISTCGLVEKTDSGSGSSKYVHCVLTYYDDISLLLRDLIINCDSKTLDVAD